MKRRSSIVIVIAALVLMPGVVAFFSGGIIEFRRDLDVGRLSEMTYQEFVGSVRIPESNRYRSDNNEGILAALMAMPSTVDPLLKLSYLVKEGVDVDVADKNGHTPLMVAVEVGSFELARLLIEHGADVERRDRLGMRAVDYISHSSASQRNKAELLGLLLGKDRGVDTLNGEKQRGKAEE